MSRAALVGCLAALVVALLGAVVIGPANIPAGHALRAIAHALPFVGEHVSLAGIPPGHCDVVLRVRLPRAVLGVVVGAALAAAGAVMQGFFRNPMADPYIIGISPGAALGAVLAIVLDIRLRVLSLGAVPLFAFAGALAVTFVVYALARRGGRVPVGTLLLTGIAVGALASAVTSALIIYRQNDMGQAVVWLMGSLNGRGWGHVAMVAPLAVAGAAIARVYARELNVMLLGDEPAQYVGVDVERARRALLVTSAMLAAAAVAACGVIGFVGLIVPHMMRRIVGPDHRRLLPASLLAGAALVVLADLAARTVLAPRELPIGIITAVIGAPFFLYLLWRTRETAF